MVKKKKKIAWVVRAFTEIALDVWTHKDHFKYICDVYGLVVSNAGPEWSGAVHSGPPLGHQMMLFVTSIMGHQMMCPSICHKYYGETR